MAISRKRSYNLKSNKRSYKKMLIGGRYPIINGYKLTSKKVFPNKFDFRGHDLSGINLSGCTLKFANFKGVNLKGTDFTGANLENGENLPFTNIYLVLYILYEKWKNESKDYTD